MNSGVNPQERRRFRRFPAATLNVQMLTRKGLFKTWEEVDVGDFSSHGIAIYLGEAPKIEQTISLRLVLEMDMGDIRFDSLDAVVRNIGSKGTDARVGLEFILDKKSSKREDQLEKLNRISEILEKSVALSERLKSQRA